MADPPRWFGVELSRVFLEAMHMPMMLSLGQERPP
jgi:hypothetical protein